MKIINLLLCILLFIFTSCSISSRVVNSKDCNTDVKVTKYKTGLSKSEGKLVEKGNHFYVYFTEGYENDNIKAFINGKLLFNETISTDESLGTTEKGFYYKYNNRKEIVSLKVVKNGKQDCLDLTLDKSFRQLFIYSNKNNWEVIYDNVYPLYE